MIKTASIIKLILLAVCIVALARVSGFSLTIVETGRPAEDAAYAASCAEFRAPGSPAAKNARDAANSASKNVAAGNLSAAMADADVAFQAAATVAGCTLVVYKPPLDGKYRQDIFGSQKGPHT
jgi:hypothetical protein